MHPEKLSARHSLDNGLTLELWDRSRPVAGDRWLVVLEARVVIPVREPYLPPDLAPEAAAVAAALGPEIVFSQKDERHFIAAREVPGLLQEMTARALDLAANYFGRQAFPGRLLRRRYVGHQERRRYYGS
jgi:hypothetical protein